MQCAAAPCNYAGGPFPDGFIYHVSYKNAAGAVSVTPELTSETQDH
jgi:hypothetical protein